MARATAEVRLPDSPELQAAIAKVKVAINADTAQRAEDALQHYQDAVGVRFALIKIKIVGFLSSLLLMNLLVSARALHCESGVRNGA